MRRDVLLGCGAMAFLACLGGCNRPAEPAKGAEEDVRQVFSSLQHCLKAKDADKIWSLLDEDSRADAEREAEGVRNAYAKADDAAKKGQEERLGVPGAELAALKGPGFLKTRRFIGKYDEIPDSKIDKVSLRGDTAAVNYTEPDGDQEKLALVRQAGQWKVSLPMPKDR